MLRRVFKIIISLIIITLIMFYVYSTIYVWKFPDTTRTDLIVQFLNNRVFNGIKKPESVLP